MNESVRHKELVQKKHRKKSLLNEASCISCCKCSVRVEKYILCASTSCTYMHCSVHLTAMGVIKNKGVLKQCVLFEYTLNGVSV